jgi:phosphate-selective porin OprO/OprP
VGAVGIVALLALAPTPAHAQEEFPDSLWNYFQTPWLNVVFGLAIVMDVTSYNQDQASKDYFGNLNEGREGEIRGLRGLFAGQVRVLGKSYDYLFAAAYRGFDRGFEQQTDDEFAVFDLAVTVPVGTDLRVNVGKQKEPFSHDRVQSMLYNPSHERPAYIDGVTRSRNDGILLERWNAQARWKWAVGYYNDWLSPGGLSFLKNPYSLIGRVTGLPIDREADGGPLLHIGGSLNKTWVPETRTSSITAKPEAFFAPNFIDTGPIDIDGAVNLGLEAAFVHGAWNLSGEIIRTDMRQPNGSSPDLWGWHMQAGWTITGERRSYDRRWGVVSLLDPESPTGIGGVGAWQLSARYSYMDANDAGVAGGIMHKYSANLQWYLSRFTFSSGDRDVRSRLRSHRLKREAGAELTLPGKGQHRSFTPGADPWPRPTTPSPSLPSIPRSFRSCPSSPRCGRTESQGRPTSRHSARSRSRQGSRPRPRSPWTAGPSPLHPRRPRSYPAFIVSSARHSWRTNRRLSPR